MLLQTIGPEPRAVIVKSIIAVLFKGRFSSWSKSHNIVVKFFYIIFFSCVFLITERKEIGYLELLSFKSNSKK